MATLSPQSAANTKNEARNPQRLPPPSLFQGPPSHNASNVSLPSLMPIATHTSTHSTTAQSSQPRGLLRARSFRAPEPSSLTSPLGRSSQQQRQQQTHQNEGDRTDALWAEMQATLAEVELSAARGTHFFGPEHAKALEELRDSQIALAQAWARSEAEEVSDRPEEKTGENVKGTGVLGDENREGRGRGLEEETEEDIKMARKRREANDRYFSRVNAGMLDVVGKLEDVATAMGKVEKESREVWSGSESMVSSSPGS